MIDEINALYDSMSKGHKKIADYVLNHPDKAAFMTAAKLGEACGTSESTVVRFAVMLGYSGYSDFQKEVASHIQSKLTNKAQNSTVHYRKNRNEILKGVLVSDAQNIVDTIHLVDSSVYDMALKLIKEAAHVYIIGIRTCAPLASYLGFYLNMIRPDVKVIDSMNISEIYEQLFWLNHDDVLIGISFPRYSMRTLKAMEYGNEKKARLISITDSEYSPMNMYSSCNLWAKSDMISIADSLVAPMSVINALIVGLYINDETFVKSNLEQMEALWNGLQTYRGDELADGM
ncbi:MAG: MurR/RpiR family transcriptional regulator [Lachnospiraceae bacterium]|nr:MurR/RpiR family transcriptional regulator [Lachnospiraceae bacterium]